MTEVANALPQLLLEYEVLRCGAPQPATAEQGYSSLADDEGAALRGLRHLDAHRKTIPKVLEVRDDEDLFEVGFDGLDGFDDAVTALQVLGSEAFVDNQRLEPRARAVRQQP